MRFWKSLLPLVMVLANLATTVHASYDYEQRAISSYNFEYELDKRDYDVLRQFVNSKRTLDVQEKACNLTISGDVRSEYRYITERRLDRHLRGVDWNDRIFDRDGLPLSHNLFNVKANLRFDYIDENAWGVMHLMFSNAAGVDQGIPCRCLSHDNCVGSECDHRCHKRRLGDEPSPDKLFERCGHHGFKLVQHGDPHGWQGSGTRSGIDLRKAFVGFNLYADDTARFDIEVGRRNLYNIFDSNVQFLSRFDGILFKFSDTSSPFLGDWYWNLGTFVIDDRVNHFGVATEVGLLNVCNKCVDLKYSYIDWNKNGRNRCGVHHPDGFKFRNSQFTLIHRGFFDYLDKQTKAYGAVVINHAAHSQYREFCNNKRFAWYVGFTLGRVLEAGDWSVDLQYQYVEANAIPDRDVSGIGRGNVLGESFTASRRGNTNFQGMRLEAIWALSDNLSLDGVFEYSQALDKHIGGDHNFSQLELEVIYAF
jgi:hypothetical protein